MKVSTIALPFALCFAATTSWAGLDITRMTTAVDDFGGSYTTTTNARAESGSITGASQVEFANFYAGNEDSSINGLISDEYVRTETGSSSVANGSFVVATANESVEISFEGVQIERQDGTLTLTGEVTANGEVFDINELPQGLQRIMRSVFRRLHR